MGRVVGRGGLRTFLLVCYLRKLSRVMQLTVGLDDSSTSCPSTFEHIYLRLCSMSLLLVFWLGGSALGATGRRPGCAAV